MAYSSRNDENDTYYDNDLSTLTNLRLHNRRSKQKLMQSAQRDELFDLTNTTIKLDNKKSSTSLRDEYIRSPTQPSPLRKSYTARNTTPQITDYRIDSSFTHDDNLKYLDRHLYETNSRLNELKRQRILNSIKSPSKNADLRNINVTNSAPSSLMNDAKDHGFRPRSIPNLQPDSKKYSKVSPVKNLRKSSSKLDHEINDILKEDENIYEKDDFAQLVTKYNLTETSQQSEVDKLQKRIQKLEGQLKSRDNGLKYENDSLQSQIRNLNDFIKFLEVNFDKIYQKSHVYKEEKQQLEKTNESLQKLLKKYQSLNLDEDDTKNELNINTFKSEFKDIKNDFSTHNLMNFNYADINR